FPGPVREDLEEEGFAEFYGRRAQYSPYRASGPALFPYDLAQVLLSHSQLQDRYRFPFDLVNRHLVGLIDERPGDNFDKPFHRRVLHEPPPYEHWSRRKGARAGDERSSELRPGCARKLGSGSGLRRRFRLALYQAPHRFSRLRSAFYPIIDPLAVKLNVRRLSARVVVADVFDEPAISFRALLRDHNPIERLLLCAHSRQ